MAFILPKAPTLVENIATGLGSGLEALAQQKLQQIQQRNLSQQLSQILPGQEQKASALSQLPEALQQTALKDLLAVPGREAYAQALGLGEPAQQGAITSPAQLSEKQATEIAKLRQKEATATSKERVEAFRQTKAERKELVDKGRAARQTLTDLNRLEELEKEGLPSPGYEEFLNRSGLNIPALRNSSGEEFKKIAANFTKNARAYFGSRISNFELEKFLETIPALNQSPEGRKRVIANLKNIARLEVEAGKAAREIIKENKGIPPLDLYERVDERIDKKAEKFAKKFKKDLARSVPAAPSKLATAAGATLGELAGAGLRNIGPIAGAGAGYYFGGRPGAALGTLAGGGLQSLLGKLLGGGS